MKIKKVFSKVIAGVMNWGDWGAKFNTAAMSKLIEDCMELGVTSFDHADIYGGYTTESDFGKALHACNISRDKIQLISKCGICLPCVSRAEFKIKSYNTSDQYIKQQVNTSLKNLNTEYLDVLLIHRPSPLMDYHAIAKTFEDLKRSGKVLYFGVSNFTSTQFEILHSLTPLVTNQLELSLLNTAALEDGTIAQCQKHQVQVSAWSPLGGGKLFETAKDADLVYKLARLKKIADTWHIGLDELSYIFLANHPAQIVPVTGSTKIERIKKAVDGSEVKITNEQWFKLWQAIKGKEVP